jgi:hypothetical protein
MVWLIAFLSLLFPRIVIFGLWVDGLWFANVFKTWYWPLLGFFFMPHTTLWYSAVQNWYGGKWEPWHIGVLILWIFIDLAAGGKHGQHVCR